VRQLWGALAGLSCPAGTPRAVLAARPPAPRGRAPGLPPQNPAASTNAAAGLPPPPRAVLQNFLALIPLALFLGEVTEDLAVRFGDTIGGLLNATFGNVVEL
jgi:hypothetical protein